MDNCLQKIKAHFSPKVLVFFTIFMIMCMSAQADNYTWTGNAGDGLWTTAGNWDNTTTPESPATTTPGSVAGDSVIIPDSLSVILDSDVTIATISIGAGASLYIKDCDADFSSVTSANFTNNGTIYFYNTTGSTTTFKTPSGGNLGTFHFWGNTNITLFGSCTASSFNMQVDPANNYITSDFEATLNGSGSLTVDDVNLTRASATTGKKGTFTVATNLTVNNTLYTHSGVIFQIQNGTTVEANYYTHSATNADVIAKTIINGSFKVTETFDMALNAGGTEVTVGTSGELTAKNVKSSQSTYNNTAASSVPFTNKGEITISGSFNIPYDIPNSGTITADGTTTSITANSFSNNNGIIVLKNGTSSLEVAASSTQNKIEVNNASATLKGSYSLTTFDASTNMGGQSVTLNNANIEAGTIKLQGASAGSLLSLTGTAATDSFKPVSTLNAEYLSIDENILLEDYTDSISHCYPSATTPDDDDWLAIIRNGWAIKALKSFVFTWTGNISSIWTNGNNWDTGLAPEEDCKIIIPAGCTNYPVLGTGTYTGGTLTLSDTTSKITLGASDLSLSGKENETTASTTLSNSGTIVFTDNGRITNGTNAINDVSHGTIEYAGSTGGIITDFDTGTNDDYYNLVISGNNWNLNSSLKLNEITLYTGVTCTLTGTSALQAQTFTFDGKFSSNNYTLTLTPYTPGDDFTIPAGINNFVFSGTNGWLYLGDDTSFSGNILFNDTLDLTYKIKLNGSTTLNADVKVRNSVTATDDINGIGKLIFTGTGNQIFTPTTGKNYSSIQVNKTAGSLTVNEDNYTITNLSITNATSTTFTGTPIINSFSTNANAGNIIFSNGGTITNTNNEEIKTSGNVSIDASSTAFTVTGDFKQTAGSTSVKGNISAANFYASNLIVDSNATITSTAASGQQTYNTISAKTAGSGSLILNASSVAINGGAATYTPESLTSLSINSDITIGTGTVILAANQIDFAGNISGTGNKLTIDTPVFNSTAASPTPGSSTITLNELALLQDTQITSTNAINLNFNLSKITSDTDKTITFAGSTTLVTLATGIEIEPSVINNQALTCAGSATFKNNYSGTGALTLSTDTTEFNGNLDLSSVSSFTHPANGKVTINPAGTTATVSGPVTFYDFEVKKSVTINGDNTYNNFTANNLGDQTLTFEAGKTQTINGNLTLAGSDEDHKLTLTSGGTWTITCPNEPSLNFLIVEKSTASGANFTALKSKDKGGNTNWNFPDMIYKWTGGNNTTVWTDTANWEDSVVPTKGAAIEIQVSGNNKYPLITSQLDLNTTSGGTDKKGTITIDSGASFNLAGQNLIAGSITNNGTFQLLGIGSQTINADMVNGADSTVEYTGTGTDTSILLWDGNTTAEGNQYENLIFSRNVNITGDDINITAKNITIDCAQINNSGNQNYNGSLTIKSTTTGLTSTSGNINFTNSIAGLTGSEELSLEAISGAGSVTFGNSSDDRVTNLSVLSVNAATVINTDTITTFATQNYTGIITLNQNLSLSAGTSLTFGSDIDGSSRTLILNTPTLISSIGTGSTEANINLTSLSLSQNTSISSANAVPLNLNITNINGSDKTIIFLSNTQKVTLKAGINIAPEIENHRPLECLGAATFQNNYSGNGSNAELTLSSAATSFKANLDLSGTTFNAPSGTVQFNGSGTTQSLTTKADGSTHFYNIVITTPAVVSTTSSFFVDGVSWSNTNTTNGFSAGTPSEITFNYTALTIGGNNTFNKIVFPIAAQEINVTGSNTISDLTSSAASQSLTFTSKNIFDTITIAGANTNFTAENTQNEFNGSITIGSTPVQAGTVSLRANTSLSFAADLNCNSLTLNAGSNQVTFNGNASYNSNFVNNGSAPTYLLAGFTGNGNATFAGDVIFQGSANTAYSLSCPAANLIKCKNFMLYSGDYTFAGKLECSDDFIILGSSYITDDSVTGISDVYIYNQPRASAANFTGTFPIPSNMSGKLTANAGASIKVGKNFYTNGTALTGSSDWYIQLSKTSDAEKGFAEAIKTTVSNCKVTCHQDSSAATDDTAPAKVAAYECNDNGGNSNWDFNSFEILNAYTVRDNSIYVEFNAPIRNLHNEINGVSGTPGTIRYLEYQDASGSTRSFEGIYSNPDCTNKISDSDVNKTEGVYKLYIKAPSSWNTDANGTYAGTSMSCDRNGNNKTAIPYMDIPSELTAAQTGTSAVNYIITNRWGKRLNNYSSRSNGTTYTSVADKTGPVLWTVRTGQELHDTYNTATGEASQHSYDSHNFLEFRYSEPVDIGSGAETIAAYSAGTTPNVIENVQVTDTLGAISENITSSAATLTFAGLAKITAATGTSLQLYTGSNGSANKYMNALYRQDPYSIRISIAGWTDGTVTDYAGNSYKKWPGYIESASQFTDATAKAVASTNTLVTDQAGNHQIEYAAGSRTEPTILSDSSGSHTAALLPTTPADTYSPWDLSSPVFTPLRFSRETDWGDQAMSEAIGNTNGSGSTLDRIDFHFFDNTPTYSLSGTDADEAVWYSQIGWCNTTGEASKANLFDNTYTYCADIVGGARQFYTDASCRTTGGIRFSTKADIASTFTSAFKYSTNINNPSPSNSFQNGIAYMYTTVVSQLFTGSSNPMRPANDPDGLYMGLGLTDSNLSVDTTFSFSYSESLGYLTDLAGNRLRSKISKTIDRTPPSFDVIISPIDTKSIYILFVKQIVTDSTKIRYRLNYATTDTPITVDFDTLIPRCFRIISIDSSGQPVLSTENQIDTSTPAQIVENFSNESFTCIKLTTTKEINIDNLKNLYIQLINHPDYEEQSSDPLTNNIDCRVTFIQDYLGNYMSMYSAHALSDFAVNYVNPLYAYSTDMLYEDQSIMNGLYEAGSWAVHDWNADQHNYGTLPAGYPISIVADTKGDEKIRVYLSPSPDADSVSKQFNSDFDAKFRIWLPALQDSLFRALSAANNTNFVYSDGQLLDASSANSLFNITKETVSSWQSGSQISFMFGLMQNSNSPVRIYNTPYYDVSTDKFNLSLSIPVPLYCLRMTDTADLNTLDLWSFKIKGITAQRGGVTILNNVINASNDEKAVVIVDMPENGNLTVCVMTLDGNIITYLNRGNTKAGEYYYTWNGKNKNGKSVARGMYFVRVLGGGIDETRKVMVVKD